MIKLGAAQQARLDVLDPEKRDTLAFIPILARDGVAAFLDGPLAARRVVFRLIRVGTAIVVQDPGGAHLGTFACPVAAAICGHDFLDREAEGKRAARPRRAKRRPVWKSQP